MIPDKIDVAGIIYEVEEKEGLVLETGNLGEVIYALTKIRIDSNCSHSKKEQIFIHEMLHAVFKESGYDEQDEDMINRVSITLYQVLKNNKLEF